MVEREKGGEREREREREMKRMRERKQIESYIYIEIFLYRSVNEVICHGIPDGRELKDGDICNSERDQDHWCSIWRTLM